MSVALQQQTPTFDHDFDRFFDYLRDDEANSVLISPKRFGQALSVNMQTLAKQAHVHPNTISRAPDSEGVQNYLRESLRVISAAMKISGEVEKALYWFATYPLSTFEYKTPMLLVSEGKTNNLLRYIDSLQAGFAG